MNTPGYEKLADVLQRAFDQAAKGKGKERHAQGEPFHEQVMQIGARKFGVGSLLFQAFKKSEESQRLPLDRGVNELLGAIVYLAGAVIARESEGEPVMEVTGTAADRENSELIGWLCHKCAMPVSVKAAMDSVVCCGQHDTCSQPCVQREQARAGADGWITWTGGECPVPGDVTVEYMMRDESAGCRRALARYLIWAHQHPGLDIIAYRIVTNG